MRFAPLFFFCVAKRCVSHLLFFCFLFLFLFLILAWIGRLGANISDFARYRLSQSESARFSANRPKSTSHRRESAQVMEKKKKKLDVAPTCRQQRPLCVTASDAGAASLAPCPCFPDYITI